MKKFGIVSRSGAINFISCSRLENDCRVYKIRIDNYDIDA